MCVLDHKLHLKTTGVVVRQEVRKEVVHKDCLQWQDRIEMDFEYDDECHDLDDDDEYAVVGNDSWTD